jgi:hypothetical protein
MLRRFLPMLLGATLGVEVLAFGVTPACDPQACGLAPGHRAVAVPVSHAQPTGWLAYEVDEATRTLTRQDLRTAPAWSVAARLIVSEVGPDRLVSNQWGLLEAVAIVETVTNRLDANIWNPEDVPGLRPWPGCGPGADFSSCAHPDQYLGLRNGRALDPRRAIPDEELLLHAMDVAVTAWWLHHMGDVRGVSNGATSFVHRCGGEAYGRTTHHCDGDPRVPDMPGAESATGPLVLKGPAAFDATRGRYQLTVTKVIDFDHRGAELR